MNEWIQSILIITIEVFCCRMFFESFTERRKRGLQSWIIPLLIITSYLISTYLSQFLVLKQLVIVTAFAAAMYICYQTSIKKAFVLSALFQGLSMAVDYVAFVINSVFFADSRIAEHYHRLEGVLIVLLGRAVLFCCVLLIYKKLDKRNTALLADTQWFCFLFFPVVTIVSILAMLVQVKSPENTGRFNSLPVVAFGMVALNFVIFYMIHDIAYREAKLHEKRLAEIQAKNQMRMYASVTENLESQKKKTHEYKNHIFCIQALLEKKEYEELTRYVQGLAGKLESEKDVIDTNHVIVNAILNAKYREAVGRQIGFSCRVNDLSGIPLEDEDIVVLLSNLLNNAIEASGQCKDRKMITLKMEWLEKKLILSVKNTAEHPPQYQDGKLQTSKSADREEHGVGIKNIIRIVQKYHGDHVIRYKDGEFYFSIVIPG